MGQIKIKLHGEPRKLALELILLAMHGSLSIRKLSNMVCVLHMIFLRFLRPKTVQGVWTPSPVSCADGRSF